MVVIEEQYISGDTFIDGLPSIIYNKQYGRVTFNGELYEAPIINNSIGDPIFVNYPFYIRAKANIESGEVGFDITLKTQELSIIEFVAYNATTVMIDGKFLQNSNIVNVSDNLCAIGENNNSLNNTGYSYGMIFGNNNTVSNGPIVAGDSNQIIGGSPVVLGDGNTVDIGDTENRNVVIIGDDNNIKLDLQNNPLIVLGNRAQGITSFDNITPKIQFYNVNGEFIYGIGPEGTFTYIMQSGVKRYWRSYIDWNGELKIEQVTPSAGETN